MNTVDWSMGRFEQIAPQLLPAARAALDLIALKPGTHLVDIGCGTGNAALLAAQEPGVLVTGVDPAPRLLEIARRGVERLDVKFVQGDAAAIPLPDASADVVMSVFGVIFAADPVAAAADMARVATSDGQIVFTAWLPGGLINAVSGVFMEAVAKATGGPPGPMFAWHDEATVRELLRPHGFDVRLHERELTFTAASVADYWQNQVLDHPFALAFGPLLRQHDLQTDAQERAIALLTEGNENPAAFQATARYVLVTARRQ
ncbi:class I SAM-dependent methyltransferase [Actinocrispum wychmicini]|uniref:Ubiquinone/menaquinone biosynthesis C-methylase UbiE n=1 Tax=Actinocrispum wychmicini TaxID=1213861 RepID=A0A4R2JGM8_9PSEU|nr:class I SAM-dependent methyltransferase [Actinocrispum wychmicini]TCO56058.1 ubiquinone/menaquinone biosynthesis C-methylase UbiE [Actinocrispum wychmicini]